MTRSASSILEQEFLLTRAKILEVAAFFDRFTGAEAEREEDSPDEEKLELLMGACRILTDSEESKAARVQLLFSRAYEEAWREKMSI